MYLWVASSEEGLLFYENDRRVATLLPNMGYRRMPSIKVWSITTVTCG